MGETEFVKAGFTKRSGHRRASELQSGCPTKVECVAEFEGDEDLEQLIHDKMSQHRSGGGNEWYFLNQDVKRYFRRFGVKL